MAKVLIIGTAYPYRGGLAVYNERLAKAFADNGDEVKIETFKLQYPGFLFREKLNMPNGNMKEILVLNVL